MSKVLFISDLHFGHRNILTYRPDFSSIEEHDRTIIERWNSVVATRDLVWILGDVYLTEERDDYPSFMEIFNKLKGNKRIITGNHDKVKYYPANIVHNALTKRYGLWLSHAPIHPQELMGKINLHGHCHLKSVPDNRYINVCCEQINYTPITLEQIRARIGATNAG